MFLLNNCNVNRYIAKRICIKNRRELTMSGEMSMLATRTTELLSANPSPAMMLTTSNKTNNISQSTTKKSKQKMKKKHKGRGGREEEVRREGDEE